MPRFAVIGLGRFGSELAIELCKSGAEVIAIDRRRDLVEELRDDVTLAVRLDTTDPEALEAQGISKVDVAIIGIGDDFESACLTVAHLKTLGVPWVICRAETAVRERILKAIGADQTVNPEGESALRWSHRLMLPKLHDYVELGEGHSMVQIDAPTEFFHKTPADLQLRRKYNVNLVAIKRAAPTQTGDEDKATKPHEIIVPRFDTIIEPNDVLILVGTNDSISSLPTGGA